MDIKIGNQFKLSEKVTLHIEDILIDVDIEKNKYVTFLMCYQTHIDGTASEAMPYLPSQIIELIS